MMSEHVCPRVQESTMKGTEGIEGNEEEDGAGENNVGGQTGGFGQWDKSRESWEGKKWFLNATSPQVTFTYMGSFTILTPCASCPADRSELT